MNNINLENILNCDYIKNYLNFDYSSPFLYPIANNYTNKVNNINQIRINMILIGANKIPHKYISII